LQSSWINIDQDSDFPIENIPFGIFSIGDESPRPATRIGDTVIDLSVLSDFGYFDDLDIESPYNTYRHNGLPPGPINNPGKLSILAALYPENNNYLYFAAKGDGSHRFAETYDEHKKNAKLYRDYLDQLEKDRENK